jgi:hypothetical protein
MSELSQAIAFASRLYRERAGIACAGYLRRDPMTLLQCAFCSWWPGSRPRST